jgi:predicted AAA+ superfamily ATPase
LKGSLAEQFVGMEIMKNQSCTTRPQLFCRHREKRGSTAEVDYLMQKNHKIIPIEVKSGIQGKMQSLRIFLQERKIAYGFRVSGENFGQYDHIRVMPMYAIGKMVKW